MQVVQSGLHPDSFEIFNTKKHFFLHIYIHYEILNSGGVKS